METAARGMEMNRKRAAGEKDILLYSEEERKIRKCEGRPGLWLKVQASCGRKDPRKLPARNRAVIMAQFRSKSSGNRIKASVGSKTRSAGRPSHFHRKFGNYLVPFFFFCGIIKT